MTQEGTKRKLAAILSADVEGYSRLMGEDEEATVRTLTAHREVMSTLIEKHLGRVVDSPGDNMLAEFASVVDAVRCAVEIQEQLKARNAELSENRRMEFRIGINLGDVVEEQGRIYGDGVNVAARVESLAEGGGICISGKVYEEIERKLALEYEYLGKKEVKNIEKPVPVYRVLFYPNTAGDRRLELPSVEPANVEKMVFPLPDQPSIAVMPFDNMSGDPEQEYFCDGMTEQIITSLSIVPNLFVIARDSTFTHKGKAVKVQQVAEEMGVRYVLEGSIQKTKEKIRVTAKLIDTIQGHHVWADRYDRDLKDIFALQDEITMEIINALQVKLKLGEGEQMSSGRTSNLKAYEDYLRGRKHLRVITKEDNALARQWYEKAIELDENYADAWAFLAFSHLQAARFRWSESPGQSYKRAEECAQKALNLDDSNANANTVMGYIRMYQKNHDECIEYGEKAVALAPNSATDIMHLALFYAFAGRFDEGIAMSKKAMRLSPYYSGTNLVALCLNQYMSGRYEEALPTAEQLLDRSKKGEFSLLIAHRYLAAIYMCLGREEEARAHAAEVLKIDPKFTLEIFKGVTMDFKDPAHAEKYASDLSKAGIPEK